MRRRGTGLRLVADRVRANSSARRPTDRERREAAALLRRAEREGRFGASDLYERRLDAIEAATSSRDLDAEVADLDTLVPESVRAQILELLCKAQADGRLTLEDFDERTTRCLGPLSAADADAAVSDLGHRIAQKVPAAPAHRAARYLWGIRDSRALSVLGVPAVLGAATGAIVVIVPGALSVPGGAGQWIPLALGCGFFSAIATAISVLAWKTRVLRDPRVFAVWQLSVGEEVRRQGRAGPSCTPPRKADGPE